MFIKKTTSSRIIIHNKSLALIKNATDVAKILIFSSLTIFDYKTAV